MCLTIPGKVIEIKNQKALLKTPSGVRQINIGLVSGVEVGDWLLATTDLAVKKIKAREAEEILKLLAGQKVTDTKNVSLKFKKILQAAQIRDLTKDEIIYLLKTEGEEKEALFSEADAVRKENLKDFICLHAIIEFSNHCVNNCFYCGLRRDNKTVKRYRMSVPEIIKVANEAVNKIGYKMLVLQSGVDNWYTDKMLVDIIKKIKAKSRCFIFMSIGERSVKCYEKMKKAGANGVLFRFETSNQKLYGKLHPEDTPKGGLHDGVRGLPCGILECKACPVLLQSKLCTPSRASFALQRTPYSKEKDEIERSARLASPICKAGFALQSRIALLSKMKKMGYYISSGSLIGLPSQTVEDLADDILMMKKIGAGMVSMGPFVPCDNTPLASEPHGDVELSLKMIAVSRLVMPKSRIPVTTALETLDPEGARKRGLQSGANSLMFNLTPAKYRGKYKIYPNKFYGRDKNLEDFALYKGKESWEMLEKEFSAFA